MADGAPSRTVLWSKADLDRVVFLPAKRLGNGGVRVDVEYDLPQAVRDGKVAPVVLRQKLRVQTPRFRRAMIGESKFKAGKWTAAFACNGFDTPGSEVNLFLENWMRPLEARVQETSQAQSLAWFKKELDLRTLNAMYTSCIKPASEASKEKHGSDLAPLLKCNIESSPSRIELDVYKGTARTPSSLAEYRDFEGRKEVVAILDIQSVWFMGKEFGVTPVLRSLWFFPEDRPQGFAFVEDEGTVGGEQAIGDEGGEGKDEQEASDRDLALKMLEDPAPAKKRPKRGEE